MIFQSVYNGPVQYYARLLHYNEVVVEQFDHYLKQTYRNRCRIAGPNGIMNLSIPVINDHGSKTLMKDVRIDYTVPWQKIHLRGIIASYASSPFYEFIIDDFLPFYRNRSRFLIDLNHGLLETTLNILGIETGIVFSDAFHPVDERADDPRFIIHPKRDFHQFDKGFKPVSYNQVFIDRHGFIPNLSILDLLFNEGLNAGIILEQSFIE